MTILFSYIRALPSATFSSSSPICTRIQRRTYPTLAHTPTLPQARGAVFKRDLCYHAAVLGSFQIFSVPITNGQAVGGKAESSYKSPLYINGTCLHSSKSSPRGLNRAKDAMWSKEADWAGGMDGWMGSCKRTVERTLPPRLQRAGCQFRPVLYWSSDLHVTYFW